MSDLKRKCPGCHRYSSSVGVAIEEGAPCPSCGRDLSDQLTAHDAWVRLTVLAEIRAGIEALPKLKLGIDGSQVDRAAILAVLDRVAGSEMEAGR